MVSKEPLVTILLPLIKDIDPSVTVATRSLLPQQIDATEVTLAKGTLETTIKISAVQEQHLRELDGKIIGEISSQLGEAINQLWPAPVDGLVRGEKEVQFLKWLINDCNVMVENYNSSGFRQFRSWIGYVLRYIQELSLSSNLRCQINRILDELQLQYSEEVNDVLHDLAAIKGVLRFLMRAALLAPTSDRSMKESSGGLIVQKGKDLEGWNQLLQVLIVRGEEILKDSEKALDRQGDTLVSFKDVTRWHKAAIEFVMSISETLGYQIPAFGISDDLRDNSYTLTTTLSILRTLSQSPAPHNSPPPKQLVALIHGIRTNAAWAEMVASTLEQEAQVEVVPLRYGYLDLIQFLIPIGTRKRPIERITRELRYIRMKHPQAKISVLAHSFGTYAISKILKKEADIKLYRLVLCGSIIDGRYRWDLVGDRIEAGIVNDCGTDDIWPLLAKAGTWGYGPSGTFGFGTARIRDRFHRLGHSDYFDKQFVSRYWVPYLKDGTVVSSEWETKRPTPPIWQDWLAKLPLRWVWIALVVIALVMGIAKLE